MANKTKTTEDHMIEQTFENFDNEITGSQSDQTQMTGITQEPSSNEKKKNTYNLLFIAGGATFLALGGYFFLFKDSGNQNRPVAKKVETIQEATNNTPPAATASEPVKTDESSAAEKYLGGQTIKADQPIADASTPAVVDPLAQLQQGVNNTTPPASTQVEQLPQQQAPVVVDPLAQLQQNANVNSVNVPPVAPASTPVVVDPLAQLQQNAANNQVQVAPGKPMIIDGVSINPPKFNPNDVMQQNASNGNKTGSVAVINNMGLDPTQQSKDNQNVDAVVAQVANPQTTEVNALTQQTDENKKFVDILESINAKFGTVEKIWEEQKVVNTKVDERLTALEKAVLGKKTVSNVAKVSTGKSNVARRNTNVRRNTSDHNVLIDKSGGRRTSSQNVQEQDNSQKVEIHSIYGGRVWTKNEDGSLSTFTVGDKLPNGEIIRRIDDENFTVSTNKKTIKY